MSARALQAPSVSCTCRSAAAGTEMHRRSCACRQAYRTASSMWPLRVGDLLDSDDDDLY